MKKNLKIATILIVILISSFFLWRFLNQYLYKTKATQETVTLNFTQSLLEFKQNETKTIPFTLTTSNNTKISAVDLYFKFNLQNQDLVEYQSFSTTPNNYFDKVIKQEIINSSSYGGSKILRLVLVSKKENSQLLNSLVFNLNFRAKKRAGSTSISLHASIGNIQNQVVGPIAGYVFDLRTNNDATNITVNNQGYCTAVGDCGQNTSCQNNSCVCNSGFYNCDGNWENGCESNQTCPSQTNTPTPTPTNQPGSVSLNLKLKFQGVMREPANTNQRTMRVKIKVGGGNLSSPVSVEGNFTLTGQKNSETDALIWQGSVNLPSQITAGQHYYLLIKGPKHIQKKICENNPSETTGGNYRCRSGNQVSLSSGQNNLDFSKIYFLGGDLPINSAQDGVVDSLDTSFIRNNLGKTDPNVVAIADLNLDGRVDTQDWSMVIYALSIKTDEE